MDRFEAYAQTTSRSWTSIYIPVWIDLKTIFIYQILICIIYLHSSMDRFEAIIVTALEENPEHLHSSMDRFEVLRFYAGTRQCFIYIPVWIDLKNTL